MRPFMTIVVGHDGSARADAAMALALALRDREHGRLVLATVAHGAARARARDQLARAAAGAPDGVGVETEVLDAPSATLGLAVLAAARDADLLVLGPTHRGDLLRATGQTVAAHLLHAAPCTLAVAGARTTGLPEAPRIVVGYDGSVEAAGALACAYSIAAATGGSLRLLRALTPMHPLSDDAARAELTDATAGAPASVPVSTTVVRGSPPDRLLEESLDADLIVIGSRHHGLLRRAVAGSLSGAVIARSDLPVIVCSFPRAHPVVVPMPETGSRTTLYP